MSAPAAAASATDELMSAGAAQPSSRSHLLLRLGLLAMINLVVILGNILVILAVYVTARLRNVTNIFIVSLATADLLLGLFVLPYALMFEILDVWVFGQVWCRFWLVIDVWISTSSILNLCAISVDRYIAVTRPVKYRSIMTAKRAKTIVCLVWSVSFLICLPPLLQDLVHHERPHERRLSEPSAAAAAAAAAATTAGSLASASAGARPPPLAGAASKTKRSLRLEMAACQLADEGAAGPDRGYANKGARLANKGEKNGRGNDDDSAPSILLAAAAAAAASASKMASPTSRAIIVIDNEFRWPAQTLAEGGRHYISFVGGRLTTRPAPPADGSSAARGRPQAQALVCAAPSTSGFRGQPAGLGPGERVESGPPANDHNQAPARRHHRGDIGNNGELGAPAATPAPPPPPPPPPHPRSRSTALVTGADGSQLAGRRLEPSARAAPLTGAALDQQDGARELASRPEAGPTLLICLVRLAARQPISATRPPHSPGGAARGPGQPAPASLELQLDCRRPFQAGICSALRATGSARSHGRRPPRLLVRCRPDAAPLEPDRRRRFAFAAANQGPDDAPPSEEELALRSQSAQGQARPGCALFDDKPYVIYSALGSFYIPMLVMVFFYSRIYLVASRAHLALQRGYMTTKSWGPAAATPLGARQGWAGRNQHERVTLRIHRREKDSFGTLRSSVASAGAAASAAAVATAAAAAATAAATAAAICPPHPAAAADLEKEQVPCDANQAPEEVLELSDKVVDRKHQRHLHQRHHKHDHHHHHHQRRRHHHHHHRHHHHHHHHHHRKHKHRHHKLHEGQTQQQLSLEAPQPSSNSLSSVQITVSQYELNDTKSHSADPQARDTTGAAPREPEVGARVDRSHSCGPATPTIVVNWNPEAGQPETQLLAAASSMGQLERGHLHGAHHDQHGRPDHHSDQIPTTSAAAYGKQGSGAGATSLMASLPAAASQVRKQSMMLLSTITRGGSQTLRRLSMAATNPVDSLLRRTSRASSNLSAGSAGSRNLEQSTSLHADGPKRRLTSGGERRRTSGLKKTLDDYLMAVAGIDTSSDESYAELELACDEDLEESNLTEGDDDDDDERQAKVECSRPLTGAPVSQATTHNSGATAETSSVSLRATGPKEPAADQLQDQEQAAPTRPEEARLPAREGKPTLQRQNACYEKLSHSRSLLSHQGPHKPEECSGEAGLGLQVVVGPQVGSAQTKTTTTASTLISPLIRRRGKRTTRWHAKRLRAETKAAKTVGIIVGGFIFCWLPFFTAYLSRAIICERPDCIPQSMLSLFIWLGYINSAINPLIYGLFSADFRHAFKNILCRCSFRPVHDDAPVVSALVDNIIKSIL